MKPYLETLFRHPFLVLIPAALFPVLVFLALLVMPATYTTTATLWVDRAIVESYSGTVSLTASAEEARAFHDRLETASFRRQVINDAGLAPLVESLQWPQPAGPGAWLDSAGLGRLGKRIGGATPKTVEEAWERALDSVLASIEVEGKGENLILVTYTGTDETNAQALVNAATNNYLRDKTFAAQRKVEESVRVHGPLIAALEVEVEAARQAWANFAASLPITPSAAQEQQATALETTYRDGQARLEEMRHNQASATLSAVTEWTNKSPSATLVDPPDEPSRSLGVLGMLKFVVAGGMAGVFLGGVLVVFRTWLERTVRLPEDVYARLGMPVIAVLPMADATRTGVERGR